MLNEVGSSIVSDRAGMLLQLLRVLKLEATAIAFWGRGDDKFEFDAVGGKGLVVCR